MSKRHGVIAASILALIGSFALSACSGDSVKDDFRGDVKALGYTPTGGVSSEKESASLNMGAVVFAKPTSSSTTKPKPTATSSKAPSTTSSRRTVTVYELVVTVKNSGKKLNCKVELERRENANVSVRKSKRDIEAFSVDEVIGSDGTVREVNNDDLRDAPPASEVAAYLIQNTKQFHCA